ncbi:hypothetical protein KJ365_13335 [Glaciecola sp. XM2]|uniref:hypothetical protein n=1 Tax=Glaciecola sp. XM2 TaxID=1914931 RepID=UPI001BDF442F|nr:hypothetical protein [Glaciecola sp. XM2]MBT1451870.1 hypothetical protein [Glaciecola sp. XM2]
MSENQEQSPPADQKQIEHVDDAEFTPSSPSLMQKLKAWRGTWRSSWSKLHTNQIIYVIALVLYFMVDYDEANPSMDFWIVGTLALIGMTRELWAIFIKVWESTFGRLVMLVTYAAIANFTLALASQKVNMVIQADPTFLYHTQALTTLLMLPLWLMMFSIIAMVTIFGLVNVGKLLVSFLRLIRLVGKSVKVKEAFPTAFVVIRLILLAPVIMTITASIDWYSSQFNMNEVDGFGINITFPDETQIKIAQLGLSEIETQLARTDLADEDRQELLNAKAVLTEQLNAKLNNESMPSVAPNEDLENGFTIELASGQAKQEDEVAEAVEDSTYFFDSMIASFVYNFEAFKYSHCNNTPEQRVVFITEDEVLIVQKDKNSPNGFAFSTRPCEPAAP